MKTVQRSAFRIGGDH